MGGPAGSGGSDRSDEKKVDTYSDQLKKIQKKKSPFKRDKDGNLEKKNIIDRYVEKNPVIQTVKNVSDKMNLNRRMKFANENNINLQGLSTEQILSKDFKSKLDAKGYTRKNVITGGNDGGDNNQTQTQTQTQTAKSVEQPKVASQMDNSNVKSKLIVADKVAPTTAEMSEDERMVAIKRGKRTKTYLTKDYNEKVTLSKKALLA